MAEAPSSVVLFCATARGLRFLETLHRLLPPTQPLVVFSFLETPDEPPFLESISSFCSLHSNIEFHNSRRPAQSSIWENTKVKLMFCVGWRYMLPKSFYDIAENGTYVFHDSLLPKYRGFAPTVWALLNGEKEVGVTLFRIAEAVDSGEMVGQERVKVEERDTIGTMVGKLTEAYLALLEKSLEGLMTGTTKLQEQNHRDATYTTKRVPEVDNLLNWEWERERLVRTVRGLTKPYQGAYCYVGGYKKGQNIQGRRTRLVVWEVEECDKGERYTGFTPGRVVGWSKESKGVRVVTGDGLVVVVLSVTLLEEEMVLGSMEAKVEVPATDVLSSLTLTLTNKAL